MKTKGNKIVIIVLVILIAIVAVIAVNMLLGLKEENALVKEVEKIEKYLKAEEIIIPNMEIATKFNCLVSPIFKKIQNLRDQIIGAQQARDRLLPKLMSGELEVSG